MLCTGFLVCVPLQPSAPLLEAQQCPGIRQRRRALPGCSPTAAAAAAAPPRPRRCPQPLAAAIGCPAGSSHSSLCSALCALRLCQHTCWQRRRRLLQPWQPWQRCSRAEQLQLRHLVPAQAGAGQQLRAAEGDAAESAGHQALQLCLQLLPLRIGARQLPLQAAYEGHCRGRGRRRLL